MPINNITQTISTIPETAHRGVDVQTIFVTKQEDFQDHLQGVTVNELNTLKDQLNSRIGEINSTATTMNGYADTASTGASTATTKAGEASTSASDALAYKNQASTFATNSSNSATKASQWANNAYNAEVETGKYSAKHWSTVAQNTAASVSNFGFKNYIINGNFDIWQYSTSQTSTGYGSDDRWYNINLGSTKTHSQVLCTDTERLLFNASKFSRTIVSSVVGASNVVTKRQSIEDVTKLAGKTVTLSFWAKADSNKNIWLEFKQGFGTGGSPSTVVIGVYGQAIPLTTTWQKKTITVTLPSIEGKTLGTDGVHTTSTEVLFWFDVGSANLARIPTGIQQSGTFDIAQVQLEEGSVATPFEQRPYGLELSLCQRYYEIVPYIHWTWSQGVINGVAGFIIPFKVEKRITPTLTTPIIAAFTGTNQYGIDSISTTAARGVFNSTGQGVVGASGVSTASAEL